MTKTAASVGIVADDLTGANDAAVQFARRGWRARLELEPTARAAAVPGDVTAVVTDARAHSSERARAETSAAVEAHLASGVDHLFLKIDSTMRGSVHAQIAGALEAWAEAHPHPIAVVCPAYPAMGRTVEAGHVLVDGVGVHTTSVGRDPVTPVASDVLAELIPGSVTAEQGATLAAQIEAASARGVTVVTVDAASDAHVRLIAEAIVTLGARVVPVGSAGLAIALAEAWGAAGEPSETVRPSVRNGGRVVVQVSSLHDVSRVQYEHLIASTTGALTFAPSLADVIGADAATAWITDRLGSTSTLPLVVAVVAPAERAADEGANDLVAAGLAAITDAVVHHGAAEDAATALMLMGGEGARAVLSRLGADAIRVTDAIREGIPIGVVEGGRAHGLTVVTKAGGFGEPSSVADIVRELTSGTNPEPASAPSTDHTDSIDQRRTP